jgi:sulfate adenylyltransferase subunit 2
MMGELSSTTTQFSQAAHSNGAPHAHLSHLDLLEAEAIAILRETAAEFANPVLMYSIGKDSQVLLHLARKAFYPAKLPFPLLHVDTGWKFREMYQFRDDVAATHGLQLIVHRNQRAMDEGINPFDYSSQVYTHATKTQGLLQALTKHGFDAALGGARRDEERSRAKERVFSFRDAQGQWDPRRQRPELWDVYNGRVRPGESMRVFPMSNWTELDVWLYILREQIPVVPLYFAAYRPVVPRSSTWIMVDDDRMRLRPGEQPESRLVRFRTLGCYPLSGAIESSAATVAELVNEMLTSRRSERAGRLIDFDEDGSMESKKREGYF